jgi:hypothetical protein
VILNEKFARWRIHNNIIIIVQFCSIALIKKVDEVMEVVNGKPSHARKYVTSTNCPLARPAERSYSRSVFWRVITENTIHHPTFIINLFLCCFGSVAFS